MSSNSTGAGSRKGSASGRSKASAAKKEAKPKAQKVEWEGLTLTLPAEPPEELLFDLTEFEAGGEDGGQSMMALYRVLRSLLGSDQFVAVRNKVAELRVNDPKTFHTEAIAEKVLDAFGMSLGESSASQDS